MKKEELCTLSLPYAPRGSKTVRVYVPAHEEGETLPVIYMTDGQNLFEKQEKALGCWFTREAVAEQRQSSGKAAIIVGIHNDEGPLERACDLTPGSIGALVFPDEMPEQARRMLVPSGEAFDDFVIRTVMPAVESRFPVKTGRRYTAFCGSSSGGLQTFFTALSHPDIFGAAGAFSPCLMIYAPQDVAQWIRDRLRDEMPYLYLFSGGADPMEQEICQSVENAFAVLQECYPNDLLRKVIQPEQHHHETAWADAFRDFLQIFLSL